MLGVAVGFVGVAVVLLPGAEATGVSIGWCFLVIVSSWCWSSGSYYGRRLPLPADPFVVAVIEMLAGGLAMVLVGLARGELGDLDVDAISGRSIVAMVYLITAGAIAFSAYVWLLQNVSISTVVTHQYVNPVVAVRPGVAPARRVAAALGPRRRGADRARRGHHRAAGEPRRRRTRRTVDSAAAAPVAFVVHGSPPLRAATPRPASRGGWSAGTLAPAPSGGANSQETARDHDRHRRRRGLRVPAEALGRLPVVREHAATRTWC